MTTPNKIPGMILKGIARRNQSEHIKKKEKKWLQFQAREKKIQREIKKQES